MVSKRKFGLWLFYFGGVVSLPATATLRCDVTLQELGAHQTLRSDSDASAAVRDYMKGKGKPVSISDFYEGTLSADGSTALILTGSGYRIWNVKEKRLMADKVRFGPGIDPALTTDGSRVIGRAPDGALTVWDAKTGGVLSQFPHAELGQVISLSPDGRLVLFRKTKPNPAPPEPSGGTPMDIVAALYKQAEYEQSELTLADPQTGNVVRRLRDHQSEFREAHFSPDGKWIATTSNDGLVRCENIATGEVTVSYGTGAKPDTVEFSPDGKFLLVIPRAGKPLVLPIDGTNKPTPMARKWGEIYDGAFSPASANLLALSTDSGFHLVDRRTDKASLSITGLQETNSQIRYSSDGNFLMLSLDGGNRFVICDVATARPLYELYGGTGMGSARYSYAEAGGVIGASFTTDAMKIWETQKIPTTLAPDAKSFATADGAYRFYREPQPDGSLLIKVVTRD